MQCPQHVPGGKKGTETNFAGKVQPPALDRACDATKCAASEWLCNIMSLALNMTLASGLVAQ